MSTTIFHVENGGHIQNAQVGSIVIKPHKNTRKVLLYKTRRSQTEQQSWRENEKNLAYASESLANARLLSPSSPEHLKHPDVENLRKDLIVDVINDVSPDVERREAFEVLRSHVIKEARSVGRDPYLHAKKLHSIGELVEASFYYKQAAISEERLAAPRPSVLMSSARVHAMLFDFDTARQNLEGAVSISLTGLHDEVTELEAYANLASVSAWRHDNLEAIGWCHKALDFVRNGKPSLKVNLPKLQLLFANILLSDGNISKADSLLRSIEGVPVGKSSIDLETAQLNFDIAQLRTKLAMLQDTLNASDELDLVEPFSRHQEALAIRIDICHPGDPCLIESHASISALYREGRDYDRALVHSEKSIEIALNTAFTENHFIFSYLFNNRAAILERIGRKEAAIDLMKRAHELAKNYFPQSHPIVREAQYNLNRLVEGRRSRLPFFR